MPFHEQTPLLLIEGPFLTKSPILMQGSTGGPHSVPAMAVANISYVTTCSSKEGKGASKKASIDWCWASIPVAGRACFDPWVGSRTALLDPNHLWGGCQSVLSNYAVSADEIYRRAFLIIHDSSWQRKRVWHFCSEQVACMLIGCMVSERDDQKYKEFLCSSMHLY